VTTTITLSQDELGKAVAAYLREHGWAATEITFVQQSGDRPGDSPITSATATVTPIGTSLLGPYDQK
jgi:hypothetical protein